MKIVRNEIRTGLLVLISLAILVGVLLVIGAPGVVTKMNTYRIFFDNAGGLRPGARILLAGRKVGVVKTLYSPVPDEDRPPDMPKAEVLVEVQVVRSAMIFRHVHVAMEQPSLLGETIIDFTHGDQHSGLAPDGAYFIGERAPGLASAVPTILEKINPVIEKATRTLDELRETAVNLNKITAEKSDFNLMITRFRNLGDNLVSLSGPDSELRGTLGNLEDLTNDDSPLNQSLKNIDRITKDLAANRRLEQTLTKFQEAADNIQKISVNLNQTVSGLEPRLTGTLENTEQLTDTLKRQPWRLLWPTTKQYPGDVPVRRAIPIEQ